jgi:hypothetical protein
VWADVDAAQRDPLLTEATPRRAASHFINAFGRQLTMSSSDEIEKFGTEMYDLEFQHIGPHTMCKTTDCDFTIDTGAMSQAEVLQLAQAHRAVCG